MVGFYNKTDKLPMRLVLQTSFGHNVGYYGFVQIETKRDESSMGILDECYSLEVEPNQEWDENGQEGDADKFNIFNF